jgi:hypothetical protein
MNEDILQCIILSIDNIVDLKMLRLTNKDFYNCLNKNHIIQLLNNKFNVYDNTMYFVNFTKNIGRLLVPPYPNINHEMRITQCPYTHTSGLRPYSRYYTQKSYYKVMIEDDHLVSIYVFCKYNGEEKLIITCGPQSLFLGKDVSYYKCVIGNTILLHLHDLNYIYIGNCIYSFKSLAKIVNYVSFVRRDTDEPYPYAVDEYNNIYLMAKYIVIKMDNVVYDDIKSFNDPYQYYKQCKDIGVNMNASLIHVDYFN